VASEADFLRTGDEYVEGVVLEVRYPYFETMAVAVRQTLLEDIPVGERAQHLVYSPPPHHPSTAAPTEQQPCNTDSSKRYTNFKKTTKW